MMQSIKLIVYIHAVDLRKHCGVKAIVQLAGA